MFHVKYSFNKKRLSFFRMFFNFSLFSSKEEKKKLLFADVNEPERKAIEPSAEQKDEHEYRPSAAQSFIRNAPTWALKLLVESERAPYIVLTALGIELMSSCVAFGFGFYWIGTAGGQAKFAKLQTRANIYIRLKFFVVEKVLG